MSSSLEHSSSQLTRGGTYDITRQWRVVRFGTEVLDTWSRTVVGKRFYTSDGLRRRRHFNDDWNGTLTNSATGATVSYQQHNTYLHDLGTPGDSATGLERQTTHLRATSADGATVLIDAGRVVLSHDDDSVVFQAGPHPISDYFEGDAAALTALCEALSA